MGGRERERERERTHTDGERAIRIEKERASERERERARSRPRGERGTQGDVDMNKLRRGNGITKYAIKSWHGVRAPCLRGSRGLSCTAGLSVIDDIAVHRTTADPQLSPCQKEKTFPPMSK